MFALDRVSGVLVALATPLNRDGSVDEPSITRLVEHVLAGGVHGLLPLGSTGGFRVGGRPRNLSITIVAIDR